MLWPLRCSVRFLMRSDRIATCTSGEPESVVASAGANEFRPTSFTVAIRVRSGGGSDDRVVNLRAEVAVVTEAGDETVLGDDVRDQLIALEHSARHTN